MVLKAVSLLTGRNLPLFLLEYLTYARSGALASLSQTQEAWRHEMNVLVLIPATKAPRYGKEALSSAFPSQVAKLSAKGAPEDTSGQNYWTEDDDEGKEESFHGELSAYRHDQSEGR